jgi:phenylpropionate dioxygenase-like ring-hydroxylating dioxygenase large terminal subunit
MNFLKPGEGRVEKNGTLLCAYHAWQFDGDGKCVSIPQSRTPEKEAVLKACPKACVRSYPTQVAQGLIWCWGQKGLPGSDVSLQAALKSPLLIEELSDPQYQGRITPYIWNQRDLPYGWDFFMEVRRAVGCLLSLSNTESNTFWICYLLFTEYAGPGARVC